MSYVLGSVVLLLFLAGASVYVVGARLPKNHRASGSRPVNATPAEVYAVITDVASFPSWRRDVLSAESLSGGAAGPRYRETSRHGTLTFEVLEAVPGERLVTNIVDEGQPFGGRWTFSLSPQGAGTLVTITEEGFVNPPIFRFMSRYVFGQTATLEAYLKNLDRRFTRGL